MCYGESMARGQGARPERRIPATAAAIVDLLNSRPHGSVPAVPETLCSTPEAGVVLRPFGQPDAAAPTPERIANVRALRAALVDIVAAPDDAEAARGWEALTACASSVTLCPVFSPSATVRLRQVDGDPVVGGIVLAVTRLMADGTWPRIRGCAEALCGHVFYDVTRSRTQRRHSYDMCGNRTHVAAYRTRKKAPSEA